MSRMKTENLQNIQGIFEEKTGVTLRPRRRYPPVRKLILLAAAVLWCLTMAAFALPMFSSLDGDELSLNARYEGEGVVSIYVENKSGKTLRFQEQTKLYRWVTSEELPRLEGEPVFKNTVFEPHTSGIMTVDLSGAYDTDALEESATNTEWFYLLLTNNNFLFGQDWMCSVSFAPEELPTGVEEESPSVTAEPEIPGNVLEELRFYFEDAYGGELMAFNEANFQYQQKVTEVLARFPRTVVPALSPYFMVGGTSELLDPEPVMGKPPENVIFDDNLPPEQQYLLIGSDWSYTDVYGRMVATSQEKAWTQVAVLPRHQGETDGGVAIPLVFLFVYDAQQAKPENHAFIYGQLYSFEALEEYKVLEDDHYAVYDATDLIYTDLDAYLDHFLTTRTDVYCDDAVHRRVRNVYEFYRNKENIRQMYGYLEFPEP